MLQRVRRFISRRHGRAALEGQRQGVDDHPVEQPGTHRLGADPFDGLAEHDHVAGFVAQFGQLAGIFGRLVGFVLATRPSNRERNRRTIKLLQWRGKEDELLGHENPFALFVLSHLLVVS